MLSYCLKCKKKQTKNTKNDPVIVKTTNGKTMILSKCAMCGAKKSKFIKRTRSRKIIK